MKSIFNWLLSDLKSSYKIKKDKKFKVKNQQNVKWTIGYGWEFKLHRYSVNYEAQTILAFSWFPYNII